MNPKLMAIMQLLGQSPNDLMAMNGQNGQSYTPDYPMPEMAQMAQDQNADFGYLDVPQDFGGLDTMAAIKNNLNAPQVNQNNNIQPILPEMGNTAGMGLGTLAPESYNMDKQGLRNKMIQQLLFNMGMQ